MQTHLITPDKCLKTTRFPNYHVHVLCWKPLSALKWLFCLIFIQYFSMLSSHPEISIHTWPEICYIAMTKKRFYRILPVYFIWTYFTLMWLLRFFLPGPNYWNNNQIVHQCTPVSLHLWGWLSGKLTSVKLHGKKMFFITEVLKTADPSTATKWQLEKRTSQNTETDKTCLQTFLVFIVILVLVRTPQGGFFI